MYSGCTGSDALAGSARLVTGTFARRRSQPLLPPADSCTAS
jgi:hypothetical protein